jgi:hypothetical protein
VEYASDGTKGSSSQWGKQGTTGGESSAKLLA